MADFYIQIDSDNKVVGNPITAANLKACNPDQDFTTAPTGYVDFESTKTPNLSMQFKKYDTSISSITGEAFDYIYDSSTNKVKQVWYTRDFTDAEKTALENEVKDQWAKVGFSSWTWDETICGYKPPVEEPSDSINKGGSKMYQWNEATQKWDQVMANL